VRKQSSLNNKAVLESLPATKVQSTSSGNIEPEGHLAACEQTKSVNRKQQQEGSTVDIISLGVTGD
jgi:hypothetical protein